MDFTSRKRRRPEVLAVAGLLAFTFSEDDGTRTRNHRIDSQETTLPKGLENQACPPPPQKAWGESSPLPPELLRVVEAWATLPEPIRRAVLALVEAGAG